MNIQALLNTMSEQQRDTRSKYHMTLGKLIEMLEHYGDIPVITDLKESGISICNPHSYRGYYSDLALEQCTDQITVKSLLQELKEDILDNTLEGYKGGDFLMNKDTPVWISSYGNSSGIAVIDFKIDDGKLVLITKQVD